jgi:uncharacterized protein (DUF433 family)
LADVLKRITFDRPVLSGRPVIGGSRISVEMVVELLAKRASAQKILEDCVGLEPDGLRAAVLYACHWLLVRQLWTAG